MIFIEHRDAHPQHFGLPGGQTAEIVSGFEHLLEAFEQDELIQTWVLYHLQVIGEAARALSPEFTAQHAEIPWPRIVGMRNILVHNYFGIDVEIVWSVVERDLPQLKQQVEAILGGENSPQS